MLSRLPLFFVLPALATAALKNTFDIYPPGAQDCLEHANTAAGCDGEVVETMNACLCSDGGKGGGFLTIAAKCITKEDPRDMPGTYSALTKNCGGSDSNVAYTKNEFIALGEPEEEEEEEKETTTTTDSPAKPTPTPADPNTPEPADPETPEPADPTPPAAAGLSTGATAGIAVGAGAGGAALVGLLAFLFFRRRRQARSALESNPMLAGGAAGAAPDTSYASPYHDKSPYHESKSPAWGPEGVAVAPGGPAPNQQWHGGPVQPGGNDVHELASMQQSRPAEMLGSHPAHRP
ncbi:hypothetical protein IMZ48_44710 [Candidatus Bathyarchaeota archaeon]|nr:hypothetical protein [Candidatus Bathyarchaeota archaeon]